MKTARNDPPGHPQDQLCCDLDRRARHDHRLLAAGSTLLAVFVSCRPYPRVIHHGPPEAPAAPATRSEPEREPEPPRDPRQISVEDDPYKPAIVYSSIVFTEGEPGDYSTWALGATKDRKTGATNYRLEWTNLYSTDGWRIFYGAGTITAERLELVPLEKEVDNCYASLDTCTYTESYAIFFSEDRMRQAAKEGLDIKFFSKSHVNKTIIVPRETIAAVLERPVGITRRFEPSKKQTTVAFTADLSANAHFKLFFRHAGTPEAVDAIAPHALGPLYAQFSFRRAVWTFQKDHSVQAVIDSEARAVSPSWWHGEAKDTYVVETVLAKVSRDLQARLRDVKDLSFRVGQFEAPVTDGALVDLRSFVSDFERRQSASPTSPDGAPAEETIGHESDQEPPG